jgi:hypothetical protein
LREIVFEDSINPKRITRLGGEIEFDMSKVIVLSGMIDTFYKNDDVTVIFKNSIGNVNKFIRGYIDNKRNDDVLLYMDFPVDNSSAMEKVIDVINLIVEFGLIKIVPILIPCIEYYAIIDFGDASSDDYNIVKNLELYRDTITCKNNVSKTNISFEKYCKAVLSKIVPEKYRGSMDINIFNDIISLDECKKLVCSLPIYYNGNVTMSENIESKPIRISIDMAERLIEQSERYAVYGIDRKYIIRVKKLMDSLKRLALYKFKYEIGTDYWGE